MNPSDPNNSQWFSTEAQPHEADLRAYLRSRFPQLGDIDDVVQETYRRLLREHRAGNVREARAFMFVAARNIALDVFRRRQLADAKGITHSAVSDVVEERPDA